MTYAQNPFPGGHKIYNFGKPFLGFHYNILSLSDLFLGEKKKILKRNNTFSLYEIYAYAPSQELLPQGS